MIVEFICLSEKQEEQRRPSHSFLTKTTETKLRKFMDRRHLFTAAAILLVLLVASPLWVDSQEMTIYDHLRRYGLPIGIFPQGITTYSLDSTDGSFLLNLPQPCNAKFENEVHYDFNVSGVFLFGQIANLSGVSAQELFLWFPVKSIRVDVPDSGLIYFDVGVVDKQFALSLFERPPDCAASAPDPLSLADPEELDLKAAS